MTLNFAIDTSRFDPFKYYSAALLTMKDYGTEYRRLEDLMMKIAELNGLYVLPDTPENQEYRNTIDKYNQAYSAAVESLNRGLNPRLASDIMKVRRLFLSDVNPIYKAVEAYNKDQDKMTALGPDAIIGNKLRTIRDYYGGVNPGISYRSGKAIQQTAAGVIQGIDNALMQAPELAGSIAKLYFVLKQKGLNGNDALALILKNSQLSSRQDITDASLLIQALDGVYQQYAFDDGTPENSKVWENVVTGAIQGILAPKYSMQHNLSYLNPAQQYNLDQARKEDKFKYTYDENGLITGYNPTYLTGVSDSRRRGPGGVTERVPNGGTFHSTKTGKKEEDVASSSEIERSQVPTHIASQYPDDTKFLICRDAKGNTIGYIGIKYTDRKVQGGTQATGTGGVQETNEGDYE